MLSIYFDFCFVNQESLPMLIGISILLVCQLTGEVLVHLLSLPVPGPVVGMILLLIGLLIRGSVPRGLRLSSEGLLRHLALLYVPAGVGLMVHFDLIAREWVVILVALTVSTVLTIAATALTFQWLSRRQQDSREGRK